MWAIRWFEGGLFARARFVAEWLFARTSVLVGGLIARARVAAGVARQTDVC